MPVAGAVITAAASAYAANRQRSAADRAARAGQDAANQGREDIRGYYDQFAGNAAPYMAAGQQGLSGLQRLMSGDYSQALAGPDVQARFSMGLEGLDRSAAARGALNSGGHSADLLDYGGMMASQGIGDYRNALFGMANMGANMTSNLGSAGLSAASGMASQGNLAGQARASGYWGQANATNQGVAGALGALNGFYQQQSANNGGGTGWYFGSQPGRG
jgi:hypothetical protein